MVALKAWQRGTGRVVEVQLSRDAYNGTSGRIVTLSGEAPNGRESAEMFRAGRLVLETPGGAIARTDSEWMVERY